MIHGGSNMSHHNRPKFKNESQDARRRDQSEVKHPEGIDKDHKKGECCNHHPNKRK